MTAEAIFETFLLGIGLSMDAFGVCFAMGTSGGERFPPRRIFFAAFLFGLFQAGMPLCGWFGGSLAGGFLLRFGRIAAAVLLCGIGVKMILDRKKEELPSPGFFHLLVFALATSVDAFLAGFGFACLGKTSGFVLASAAAIGMITFAVSGSGGVFGRNLGSRVSPEKGILIGGLVLIGLGVKTLLFPGA